MADGRAAKLREPPTKPAKAAKRQRKACDWIVANDVSADTGIMGGDENAVTLITDAGPECWPRAPKHQVAARLAQRIATTLTS